MSMYLLRPEEILTNEQLIRIYSDPEKVKKLADLLFKFTNRQRYIFGIMFPIAALIAYFILGKVAFGEEKRIFKSIGIGLFIAGPILGYLSLFIYKKMSESKMRKIADA